MTATAERINVYRKLRHRWDSDVPLMLREYADALRFAQYLVRLGVLSDWPREQTERLASTGRAA